MKKQNIRRAGSLLAVMLALALLLPSLPVFAADVGDASAAESESAERYRYAVTIEFGSMTFCYDYGTWNASEMRYQASAGSTLPANGTTQGFPGWYGFDGVANRISVKYFDQSNPDAQSELAVALSYRALVADDKAASGQLIQDVDMEFYSDLGLTQPFNGSRFTVPNTKVSDIDAKTVIYASLKGEPHLANGETPFESTTFVPIGMLTIQIDVK